MERREPLKTCFVVPVGARLGGAEKMLWLFLRDVDRRRIAPSVVFLEDGPFLQECADLGLPVCHIESGRLRELHRGLHTIWRLASHFRRASPHLIVEWFGKSHFWTAPAAALAGLASRVVWWQHSVPDGGWLLRATTMLPVRAIGAESAAAADGQAALWPHRPTFVVHSGVDDEHQEGVDELRRSTRRELGVGDEELLVGMIARVQRWKGQHHLIEAIAALRARGVPCRGLLVGGDAHNLDPDYNREVEELRAQRAFNDAVMWVDQTPDPRSYLYALDVFVNASIRENLSLALLEAMAAERCIVAVADGGTPEAICDGRSGLLIAQSSSALLADAVERLHADAALRRRLALGARTEYKARFTAEGWTRAVEDRLLLVDRPDYEFELASVARQPR